MQCHFKQSKWGKKINENLLKFWYKYLIAVRKKNKIDNYAHLKKSHVQFLWIQTSP